MDKQNIQLQDTSQKDQEKSKIRTKIVIFGFLALIASELLTKKFNINSPSHYATESAEYISDCFVTFDLGLAIYDLLRPIFMLAIAPYYTLKGFKIVIINEGIQNAWNIILTGSICIISMLAVMEINTNGSYKPSSWLGKTSTFVTSAYGYFGRFISDLSSFYRVLKLEKFVDALFAVGHPIYRIMIAPIASTLKGYVDEINKYRYGHFIIGSGTITLISLAGYACLKHLTK